MNKQPALTVLLILFVRLKDLVSLGRVLTTLCALLEVPELRPVLQALMRMVTCVLTVRPVIIAGQWEVEAICREAVWLVMSVRELAGLPILISQVLLTLSFLASPPIMVELTLATTLTQVLVLLKTISVLSRNIRIHRVQLNASHVQ